MIRAGMTIAEAILQLTKGFRKMMGRDPSGLEQIKIKQEAMQRVEDLNKVVDMEGNVIDTSKGIMGGKQIQDSPEFGKKIRETYDKAKGPGKGQEMVDAMKSPGARKSYKIIEDQLGVKLYGDETFEEILEIQKTGKHPRGEPKADGGRIGYKLGSIDKARRAFLKTVGAVGAGIGAAKTGLMALGKNIEPVAETVKETVQGTPQYFFDLVAKIKMFGTQRRTPSYRERVNEYQYTGKDGNEYQLTEELDTGDIMIQKDKVGGRNYGDKSYEVIEDRTEMVYRKGQGDETTRGTPADEYEEYKVEFDQDGTAADAIEIDELSKKEIIKEATGDAPAIKKAGGGIARMLGE